MSWILKLKSRFQIISFFSNDHKESIKNWRTLEILAKSFKDYRLSRDLCATTDTKGGRTEVVPQQVTPISFDILLVSSHTMEMLSQDMERILGPVTETQNITTYCMSAIFEMEFYDIAPLVCKEAFTFYSDAKAIEKIFVVLRVSLTLTTFGWFTARESAFRLIKGGYSRHFGYWLKS